MILIDGLFINKGGGAVLLQYLMAEIAALPERDEFFYLLDPRFQRPEIDGLQFEVCNHKLEDRWRFYRKNRKRFSLVFCFANTPPPVPMRVPVYTYFHNQKLLEAPAKKMKPGYFRIYLKYLVTRLLNSHTDFYIVQTPHMVQELTALGLKDRDHCLQLPFYDDRKYASGQSDFDTRKREFVFISNPSPQKNYPMLLLAWERLLEQGRKPVLHVTVDDTAPAILERIQALNERGAQIVNHVYVDPKELYYNCQFLIFPSVVESFGLPLIEAADSGMKVLASDLPYVYDVVQPSLTFDPADAQSMAQAVIRALEEPLPPTTILATNQVRELINLLLTRG